MVVETLKVKNMLKNRKLSKHIADGSWFGLIQKLAYKAKAQGIIKLRAEGLSVPANGGLRKSGHPPVAA